MKFEKWTLISWRRNSEKNLLWRNPAAPEPKRFIMTSSRIIVFSSGNQHRHWSERFESRSATSRLNFFAPVGVSPLLIPDSVSLRSTAKCQLSRGFAPHFNHCKVSIVTWLCSTFQPLQSVNQACGAGPKQFRIAGAGSGAKKLSGGGTGAWNLGSGSADIVCGASELYKQHNGFRVQFEFRLHSLGVNCHVWLCFRRLFAVSPSVYSPFQATGARLDSWSSIPRRRRWKPWPWSIITRWTIRVRCRILFFGPVQLLTLFSSMFRIRSSNTLLSLVTRPSHDNTMWGAVAPNLLCPEENIQQKQKSNFPKDIYFPS